MLGVGSSRENICAVCNDPIYNRICALCLTDKIEGWLESKRLSLTRDFRVQVRQFLDSIKRRNKMFCVFCRIETEISVCPICFTDRVASWLGNKDRALSEDFARAFHYTNPIRQRISLTQTATKLA